VNRTIIAKLFLWQAGVTAVVAVIAAVLLTWQDAAAALMGGGINLLAVAAYAIRVGLLPPDATAQGRLAAIVRAEAVKWGVSIGLFAIAAMIFPGRFPVLILAFMATTGVYWFALLWDVPDDRQQRG
jgi:F0F1-type ATP synthase assembly protein I